MIPSEQENSVNSKIRFITGYNSQLYSGLNGLVTFSGELESVDDGQLPVTFFWKRGEVPLESTDRIKITQSKNAIQLALDHVQRDDAGHYTLYAKTKSGDMARKDFELIVEDRSTGDDPPIFLRRLADLSVKVGTRTRLLVEIRSSTDVKVTWYRNDRRICENERIKWVNEGNFYCLEIAPITLDDGGQWMCMAENLGGRNSCISHLNVLVPKAYKSPEFVEELRAILTEQGIVSLECKVIGVPTPVLRWFKDSKEIKAGDVFALTANPDDPTSLGTYTCEAVNCMGKMYSSSKVHVAGRGSREGSLKPADNRTHNAPPPIFTTELRNATVKIGDPVLLGCQVAVPPWPTSVVWYNKTGRVETNEKYRLIEDGLGVYMIEIKPSESCDEGEWKCVVTSNEGSVGISSCVVEMEIPRNYRKPRFMESLKAVLTEEGLVSFECKVVGFPTPQLKWFKDGHELKPGDVYQLTGHNSLGTYCCIARNCMGESSSTALLTVEDIQNQLNDEERLQLVEVNNQPPKFIKGLKSCETKINEEFRFTVQVTSVPEPVFSWFRDDLPIDDSDRYIILKEALGSCHLDIRRVEFNDQAEWKCVATNDFGQSVTSCFLKLQIPRHFKKPRFLECLRAVLTEEGAVNLECKVIGVPQPVLKWYKDSVELKPGDIHRIITGQDGTCCLGTYTCEARNCMGIVASSASLLGIDDAYKAAQVDEIPKGQEIQRNVSLSTINEERTSQMYDTCGDVTIDDRGDISFSFDGKEVSVSLYETPDLTEEEALQIVEMYADQISEHVTEQNVVELPPLRFVKETSTSGNLLMEAVVIDVAPDYFSPEEDLRTEADMDDISEVEQSFSMKADELALDRETEEYVKKTHEALENELEPRQKKHKGDSLLSGDLEEYFSLSHKSEDDTETDLQTFASAKDHLTDSKVPELDDLDIALQEAQALIEADQKLEEVLQQPPEPKPRKRKSKSNEVSQQEEDANLRDISGEEGDGLVAKRSTPAVQQKKVEQLVSILRDLNTITANLKAVEEEVQLQSGLMMSAASVDRSLGIIQNVLDPISKIQNKLNLYSENIPLENLFESIVEPLQKLEQALSVIEKCVEMDESGRTLVQRTSVCIVDSSGELILQSLDKIKKVVFALHHPRLRKEVDLIIHDMEVGIEITQDTIRSQALMQEAVALETAQHVSETIARMQEEVQTPTDITALETVQSNLREDAKDLKNVCRPVVQIQQALESIEQDFSMNENEEDVYKNLQNAVINKLTEPIEDLKNEILAIERMAAERGGDQSLEQTIKFAILDSVKPPLYELQKGLELLIEQPPDAIKSTNVLDSMMLPLQEIQYSLVRIGQDLESGTLKSGSPVETFDNQKLLQSIAQAVINFDTNVQSIKLKILDKNLGQSLTELKSNLSKVIENSVEAPLDKYNITILENMKQPLDDINYCLRQIEAKSLTGSLNDLLDPLIALNERVKMCENILTITKQKEKNPNMAVLQQVRLVISRIELGIEQNNLKLDEEMENAESQKVSQLLNEAGELLAQKEQPVIENLNLLENLHLCLSNIQEQMKVEKSVTKDKPQAEAFTDAISVPLKDIIDSVVDIQNEILNNPTNEENNKVLESISQPVQHIIETIMNISQQTQVGAVRPISENLEALKVLTIPLNELKQTIETTMSQDQGNTSNIIGPLNHLHSSVSQVIGTITVEPIAMAAPPAAALDDKQKLKAKQLLENIKINLLQIRDSSVEHRKLETLEKSIKEFNEFVNTTNKNVASTSSDYSSLSFLTTLNLPLHEIQDYISEQHLHHGKVDQIQDPILRVIEFIEKSQKNIDSIQAPSTKANVLEELNRCVTAIQQIQAFKDQHDLSDASILKDIAEPIESIEQRLNEIQEAKTLSGVDELSVEDNVSLLKTLISPIMEIQNTIINLENLEAVGAQTATPILELFESVKRIEVNVLQDIVQLKDENDSTLIKSFTESLQESLPPKVVQPPTIEVLETESVIEPSSISQSGLEAPSDTEIVETLVPQADEVKSILLSLNQVEKLVEHDQSLIEAIKAPLTQLQSDLSHIEENMKNNESTIQPIQELKASIESVREQIEDKCVNELIKELTVCLGTIDKIPAEMTSDLIVEEMKSLSVPLTKLMDCTLKIKSNLSVVENSVQTTTSISSPLSDVKKHLDIISSHISNMKTSTNQPNVVDKFVEPLEELKNCVKELQQKSNESNDPIQLSLEVSKLRKPVQELNNILIRMTSIEGEELKSSEEIPSTEVLGPIKEMQKCLLAIQNQLIMEPDDNTISENTTFVESYVEPILELQRGLEIIETDVLEKSVDESEISKADLQILRSIVEPNKGLGVAENIQDEVQESVTPIVEDQDQAQKAAELLGEGISGAVPVETITDISMHETTLEVEQPSVEAVLMETNNDVVKIYDISIIAQTEREARPTVEGTGISEESDIVPMETTQHGGVEVGEPTAYKAEDISVVAISDDTRKIQTLSETAQSEVQISGTSEGTEYIAKETIKPEDTLEVEQPVIAGTPMEIVTDVCQPEDVSEVGQSVAPEKIQIHVEKAAKSLIEDLPSMESGATSEAMNTLPIEISKDISALEFEQLPMETSSDAANNEAAPITQFETASNLSEEAPPINTKSTTDEIQIELTTEGSSLREVPMATSADAQTNDTAISAVALMEETPIDLKVDEISDATPTEKIKQLLEDSLPTDPTIELATSDQLDVSVVGITDSLETDTELPKSKEFSPNDLTDNAPQSTEVNSQIGIADTLSPKQTIDSDAGDTAVILETRTDSSKLEVTDMKTGTASGSTDLGESAQQFDESSKVNESTEVSESTPVSAETKLAEQQATMTDDRIEITSPIEEPAKTEEMSDVVSEIVEAGSTSAAASDGTTQLLEVTKDQAQVAALDVQTLMEEASITISVDETVPTLITDVHLESTTEIVDKTEITDADISEISEASRITAQDTTSFMETSDYPTLTEDAGASGVTETLDKDKLEEKARHLLRQTEERELTPQEWDNLQYILAQLKYLGSEVHETLTDAKIISDSTADIINKIKEEAQNPVKKNEDFPTVTTIEDITVDTSVLVDDQILVEESSEPRVQPVLITGDTSIQDAETKSQFQIESISIEDDVSQVCVDLPHPQETDELGHKIIRLVGDESVAIEQTENKTISIATHVPTHEEIIELKPEDAAVETVTEAKLVDDEFQEALLAPDTQDANRKSEKLESLTFYDAHEEIDRLREKNLEDVKVLDSEIDEQGNVVLTKIEEFVVRQTTQALDTSEPLDEVVDLITSSPIEGSVQKSSETQELIEAVAEAQVVLQSLGYSQEVLLPSEENTSVSSEFAAIDLVTPSFTTEAGEIEQSVIIDVTMEHTSKNDVPIQDEISAERVESEIVANPNEVESVPPEKSSRDELLTELSLENVSQVQTTDVVQSEVPSENLEQVSIIFEKSVDQVFESADIVSDADVTNKSEAGLHKTDDFIAELEPQKFETDADLQSEFNKQEAMQTEPELSPIDGKDEVELVESVIEITEETAVQPIEPKSIETKLGEVQGTGEIVATLIDPGTGVTSEEINEEPSTEVKEEYHEITHATETTDEITKQFVENVVELQEETGSLIIEPKLLETKLGEEQSADENVAAITDPETGVTSEAITEEPSTDHNEEEPDITVVTATSGEIIEQLVENVAEIPKDTPAELAEQKLLETKSGEEQGTGEIVATITDPGTSITSEEIKEQPKAEDQKFTDAPGTTDEITEQLVETVVEIPKESPPEFAESKSLETKSGEEQSAGVIVATITDPEAGITSEAINEEPSTEVKEEDEQEITDATGTTDEITEQLVETVGEIPKDTPAEVTEPNLLETKSGEEQGECEIVAIITEPEASVTSKEIKEQPSTEFKGGEEQEFTDATGPTDEITEQLVETVGEIPKDTPAELAEQKLLETKSGEEQGTGEIVATITDPGTGVTSEEIKEQPSTEVKAEEQKFTDAPGTTDEITEQLVETVVEIPKETPPEFAESKSLETKSGEEQSAGVIVATITDPETGVTLEAINEEPSTEVNEEEEQEIADATGTTDEIIEQLVETVAEIPRDTPAELAEPILFEIKSGVEQDEGEIVTIITDPGASVPSEEIKEQPSTEVKGGEEQEFTHATGTTDEITEQLVETVAEINRDTPAELAEQKLLETKSGEEQGTGEIVTTITDPGTDVTSEKIKEQPSTEVKEEEEQEFADATGPTDEITEKLVETVGEIFKDTPTELAESKSLETKSGMEQVAGEIVATITDPGTGITSEEIKEQPSTEVKAEEQEFTDATGTTEEITEQLVETVGEISKDAPPELAESTSSVKRSGEEQGAGEIVATDPGTGVTFEEIKEQPSIEVKGGEPEFSDATGITDEITEQLVETVPEIPKDTPAEFAEPKSLETKSGEEQDECEIVATITDPGTGVTSEEIKDQPNTEVKAEEQEFTDATGTTDEITKQLVETVDEISKDTLAELAEPILFEIKSGVEQDAGEIVATITDPETGVTSEEIKEQPSTEVKEEYEQEFADGTETTEEITEQLVETVGEIPKDTPAELAESKSFETKSGEEQSAGEIIAILTKPGTGVTSEEIKEQPSTEVKGGEPEFSDATGITDEITGQLVETVDGIPKDTPAELATSKPFETNSGEEQGAGEIVATVTDPGTGVTSEEMKEQPGTEVKEEEQEYADATGTTDEITEKLVETVFEIPKDTPAELAESKLLETKSGEEQGAGEIIATITDPGTGVTSDEIKEQPNTELKGGEPEFTDVTGITEIPKDTPAELAEPESLETKSGEEQGAGEVVATISDPRTGVTSEDIKDQSNTVVMEEEQEFTDATGPTDEITEQLVETLVEIPKDTPAELTESKLLETKSGEEQGAGEIIATITDPGTGVTSDEIKEQPNTELKGGEPEFTDVTGITEIPKDTTAELAEPESLETKSGEEQGAGETVATVTEPGTDVPSEEIKEQPEELGQVPQEQAVQLIETYAESIAAELILAEKHIVPERVDESVTGEIGTPEDVLKVEQEINEQLVSTATAVDEPIIEFIEAVPQDLSAQLKPTPLEATVIEVVIPTDQIELGTAFKTVSAEFKEIETFEDVPKDESIPPEDVVNTMESTVQPSSDARDTEVIVPERQIVPDRDQETERKEIQTTEDVPTVEYIIPDKVTDKDISVIQPASKTLAETLQETLAQSIEPTVLETRLGEEQIRSESVAVDQAPREAQPSESVLVLESESNIGSDDNASPTEEQIPTEVSSTEEQLSDPIIEPLANAADKIPSAIVEPTADAIKLVAEQTANKSSQELFPAEIKEVHTPAEQETPKDETSQVLETPLSAETISTESVQSTPDESATIDSVAILNAHNIETVVDTQQIGEHIPIENIQFATEIEMIAAGGISADELQPITATELQSTGIIAELQAEQAILIETVAEPTEEPKLESQEESKPEDVPKSEEVKKPKRKGKSKSLDVAEKVEEVPVVKPKRKSKSKSIDETAKVEAEEEEPDAGSDTESIDTVIEMDDGVQKPSRKSKCKPKEVIGEDSTQKMTEKKALDVVETVEPPKPVRKSKKKSEVQVPSEIAVEAKVVEQATEKSSESHQPLIAEVESVVLEENKPHEYVSEQKSIDDVKTDTLAQPSQSVEDAVLAEEYPVNEFVQPSYEEKLEEIDTKVISDVAVLTVEIPAEIEMIPTEPQQGGIKLEASMDLTEPLKETEPAVPNTDDPSLVQPVISDKLAETQPIELKKPEKKPRRKTKSIKSEEEKPTEESPKEQDLVSAIEVSKSHEITKPIEEEIALEASVDTAMASENTVKTENEATKPEDGTSVPASVTDTLEGLEETLKPNEAYTKTSEIIPTADEKLKETEELVMEPAVEKPKRKSSKKLDIEPKNQIKEDILQVQTTVDSKHVLKFEAAEEDQNQINAESAKTESKPGKVIEEDVKTDEDIEKIDNKLEKTVSLSAEEKPKEDILVTEASKSSKELEKMDDDKPKNEGLHVQATAGNDEIKSEQIEAVEPVEKSSGAIEVVQTAEETKEQVTQDQIITDDQDQATVEPAKLETKPAKILEVKSVIDAEAIVDVAPKDVSKGEETDIQFVEVLPFTEGQPKEAAESTPEEIKPEPEVKRPKRKSSKKLDKEKNKANEHLDQVQATVEDSKVENKQEEVGEVKSDELLEEAKEQTAQDQVIAKSAIDEHNFEAVVAEASVQIDAILKDDTILKQFDDEKIEQEVEIPQSVEEKPIEAPEHIPTELKTEQPIEGVSQDQAAVNSAEAETKPDEMLEAKSVIDPEITVDVIANDDSKAKETDIKSTEAEPLTKDELEKGAESTPEEIMPEPDVKKPKRKSSKKLDKEKEFDQAQATAEASKVEVKPEKLPEEATEQIAKDEVITKPAIGEQKLETVVAKASVQMDDIPKDDEKTDLLDVENIEQAVEISLAVEEKPMQRRVDVSNELKAEQSIEDIPQDQAAVKPAEVETKPDEILDVNSAIDAEVKVDVILKDDSKAEMTDVKSTKVQPSIVDQPTHAPETTTDEIKPEPEVKRPKRKSTKKLDKKGEETKGKADVGQDQVAIEPKPDEVVNELKSVSGTEIIVEVLPKDDLKAEEKDIKLVESQISVEAKPQEVSESAAEETKLPEPDVKKPKRKSSKKLDREGDAKPKEDVVSSQAAVDSAIVEPKSEALEIKLGTDIQTKEEIEIKSAVESSNEPVAEETKPEQEVKKPRRNTSTKLGKDKESSADKPQEEVSQENKTEEPTIEKSVLNQLEEVKGEPTPEQKPETISEEAKIEPEVKEPSPTSSTKSSYLVPEEKPKEVFNETEPLKVAEVMAASKSEESKLPVAPGEEKRSQNTEVTSPVIEEVKTEPEVMKPKRTTKLGKPKETQAIDELAKEEDTSEKIVKDKTPVDVSIDIAAVSKPEAVTDNQLPKESETLLTVDVEPKEGELALTQETKMEPKVDKPRRKSSTTLVKQKEADASEDQPKVNQETVSKPEEMVVKLEDTLGAAPSVEQMQYEDTEIKKPRRKSKPTEEIVPVESKRVTETKIEPTLDVPIDETKPEEVIEDEIAKAPEATPSVEETPKPAEEEVAKPRRKSSTKLGKDKKTMISEEEPKEADKTLSTPVEPTCIPKSEEIVEPTVEEEKKESEITKPKRKSTTKLGKEKIAKSTEPVQKVKPKDEVPQEKVTEEPTKVEPKPEQLKEQEPTALGATLEDKQKEQVTTDNSVQEKVVPPESKSVIVSKPEEGISDKTEKPIETMPSIEDKPKEAEPEIMKPKRKSLTKLGKEKEAKSPEPVVENKPKEEVTEDKIIEETAVKDELQKEKITPPEVTTAVATEEVKSEPEVKKPKRKSTTKLGKEKEAKDSVMVSAEAQSKDTVVESQKDEAKPSGERVIPDQPTKDISKSEEPEEEKYKITNGEEASKPRRKSSTKLVKEKDTNSTPEEKTNGEISQVPEVALSVEEKPKEPEPEVKKPRRKSSTKLGKDPTIEKPKEDKSSEEKAVVEDEPKKPRRKSLKKEEPKTEAKLTEQLSANETKVTDEGHKENEKNKDAEAKEPKRKSIKSPKEKSPEKKASAEEEKSVETEIPATVKVEVKLKVEEKPEEAEIEKPKRTRPIKNDEPKSEVEEKVPEKPRRRRKEEPKPPEKDEEAIQKLLEATKAKILAENQQKWELAQQSDDDSSLSEPLEHRQEKLDKLVEHKQSRRVPQFETYLMNSHSEKGGKVKLMCNILGKDVKVMWKKDNKVIENNAKYRINETDGLHTMEILDAIPLDSGEYQCVAYNPNGEMYSSASVDVYEPSPKEVKIPPTFTRSIKVSPHWSPHSK